MAEFSELLGKTLTLIEGAKRESEAVRFVCDDGSMWVQQHYQDCCETVWVEDVIGDVSDIIDSPILLAEVVSSDTTPENTSKPEWQDYDELWTFYKLATIKGSVTIRWFGSSNGYYSTDVSFERSN